MVDRFEHIAADALHRGACAPGIAPRDRIAHRGVIADAGGTAFHPFREPDRRPKRGRDHILELRVVRDFLAGTLDGDRTREFTEQLRVAGVPV